LIFFFLRMSFFFSVRELCSKYKRIYFFVHFSLCEGAIFSYLLIDSCIEENDQLQMNMVNISYFHLISNKLFNLILVLTEKEEPSSTTINLASDTATIKVIFRVKIKKSI
jgi:hypothetical protein